MKRRYWLTSLVIAAAAQGAMASDDELTLISQADTNMVSPAAGDQAKVDDGGTNHDAAPHSGNYQFLLEVAGVTPGERHRPEDRIRSTGSRPHRSPPTPRMTIDSAD